MSLVFCYCFFNDGGRKDGGVPLVISAARRRKCSAYTRMQKKPGAKHRTIDRATNRAPALRSLKWAGSQGARKKPLNGAARRHSGVDGSVSYNKYIIYFMKEGDHDIKIISSAQNFLSLNYKLLRISHKITFHPTVRQWPHSGCQTVWRWQTSGEDWSGGRVEWGSTARPINCKYVAIAAIVVDIVAGTVKTYFT